MRGSQKGAGLLLAAVVIAGLASGCQRDTCTAAPADLSGVWSGDYSPDRADRRRLELRLSQPAGDAISGDFSFNGLEDGNLQGLRIGSRIEFDASAQSCPGRFRGAARICGESLELTLTGRDCGGEVTGRGTLRRLATATEGNDARAGTGGSAGSAGANMRRAGGTRPRAGAGGQSGPPPCPFTGDSSCDEPEGTGLCSEGTDVFDCTIMSMPCPYRNDGKCDEPAGTRLCAEGQDPEDCRTSVVCGGELCFVPGVDPALPITVATRPCCTAQTRCGIELGTVPCFEVTQGVPDQFCAKTISDMVMSGIYMGCCRPDGTCGVNLAQGVLGCTPLPAAFGTIRCGGSDMDAGTL